jgi:hypothetical protein
MRCMPCQQSSLITRGDEREADRTEEISAHTREGKAKGDRSIGAALTRVLMEIDVPDGTARHLARCASLRSQWRGGFGGGVSGTPAAARPGLAWPCGGTSEGMACISISISISI